MRQLNLQNLIACVNIPKKQSEATKIVILQILVFNFSYTFPVCIINMKDV